MKVLYKVWGCLEEVLAGFFFTIGIALIFYGVIMRYIFNEPQAWVEELVRYTIIWGTFFGFSLALRHNQHIQVDILYDKVTPSVKHIIDIIANGVSIVFCVIYTYYGFILVENRYTSGMVSLDVGIPMWVIYLVLPISGILFLARFIERIINVIRRKEEDYANPLN